MKLFQNSGVMPTYLRQFHGNTRPEVSFVEQRDTFLAERYGASHFLKPILEGSTDTFFTNADDTRLQRAWARENGMKEKSNPEEILLAQIEAHGTEVFYNLDPVRFPSTFVKRLPSCVKRTIAWRAAPSGNIDFGAYDIIVCNFPNIIKGYQKVGWNACMFFPAHDPVLDEYAHKTYRNVDVLFVGGYTQYHKQRSIILNEISNLHGGLCINYHLDRSRLTALAQTPLGWFEPLRSKRQPASIRRLAKPPLFGRDLYKALSSAKIVLNGAIDMANSDRGNMRCFEAMGAAALMVSDTGEYPEGMEPGKNFLTYDGPENVTSIITQALNEPDKLFEMARAGYETVSTTYTKERQWRDFQNIA